MRANSDAPGGSAKKKLFFKNSLYSGVPATTIESFEPAVAVLDKRGVVSFSSPALGELLKISQAQLEGREMATLLPGLPLKKKTPDFNLAFAESWEHEAAWRKQNGLSPNGENIPLEVTLKKLSMNTDQYILLGVRPAKETPKHASELARLIENAKAKTDAVMITDTAGVILFINAALEKSTGYSPNEVVGQYANIIRPEFNDAELHGHMWETLLAGNDFRTIFSNCRKTGEIFHEDTHIRPFVDANGITTHFVATSRALNELLQTTLLRLQREAYHDALTGLPNRNLFIDRLRQSFAWASRRNEKFSLVYIDLDNFKEINDKHGHAAGDAVLHATAHSLNASVRNEDTVARLGGDEFALILLNTNRREDIEFVANKILRSLANGITFENQRIQIRASLGASIYPDDGDNGDSLLKQADSGMYMAKSAGGHCLHFFTAEDDRRHDGKAICANSNIPERRSAVPPQASA